jgi:hypothetical protein
MIHVMFPKILVNVTARLQVDQLVLEEVVRERFPKLGLYFNDIITTLVLL